MTKGDEGVIPDESVILDESDDSGHSCSFLSASSTPGALDPLFSPSGCQEELMSVRLPGGINDRQASQGGLLDRQASQGGLLDRQAARRRN